MALITVDENQADLVFQSSRVCEDRDERILHRTNIVERHASVGAQVLFYVASAAGFGIGAWVLSDVHNIPAANDPVTRNPVGRTGAEAIGVLQVVLGAGFLALGIGTSARGRNTETDMGNIYDVVPGSRRRTECAKRALVAEPITFLGSDGTRRIQIGTTDDKGRLKVAWEMLSELFAGAAPTEAKILAGTDSVGTIDLSRARAFWARRMLADAVRFAEKDEIEQAQRSVERCEALGGDPTEAIAKISASPTNIRKREEADRRAKEMSDAKREEARRHVEAAKSLIRRSDLEHAEKELGKARDLGADTAPLEEQLSSMISLKALDKLKKYIAQCRKVSTVREKIEYLTHCDADCEQAKRRVEKDWERLVSERPDFAGIAQEQQEPIHEQCEQAGCPECP